MLDHQPLISEIFKYVYLQRLTTYLEITNIIEYQRGFHTSRCINSVVHSFYEPSTKLIDVGTCPVGRFCALSVAFVCVDDDILIRKLRTIGFLGSPLMWIQSHLSKRQQYVSHHLWDTWCPQGICYWSSFILSLQIPLYTFMPMITRFSQL